jgi:ABC-type transporter Mla subunit MlaD
MRRALFIALGLIEFAVAAVLVSFGLSLPAVEEVHRNVGSVERVTVRTGRQVRLLRDQVHGLRDPELKRTADRIQTQMRRVAGTLRSRNIDFDTVKTMSSSLGDVADGLDGLAKTLDPETLGRIGEGLATTATFLDEKVVPAAAKAADNLDGSTQALQEDAKRLAELLRAAPLDLKAAREIHDGLGRFSEGLDKMSTALKLQRFDTMREGVRGLETSLTTGAEQVEKLSGYTYPVVTFKGVKPSVEQKKFWPEGDKIGEGMRKAAEGVAAAGKEMEGLAAELPRLRASLDESRKVAQRSKEALALALAQQDKVEPLLKNVPEHAARLAEQLPKLGKDLARVLRETERFKEVAATLRQAQKGLDGAVSRWPELRNTLSRSATLLRGTQKQLQSVVDNREEFEKAMAETVALTEEFADRLPAFTQNLDGQLADQEVAFDELAQSIDEVSGALPAYAETASRMVQATQLLLWLVAALVGLHGVYVVATGWSARPTV